MDSIISIVVFLAGIIYSAVRIYDTRTLPLIIDVALLGILTLLFVQSINVNMLGL